MGAAGNKKPKGAKTGKHAPAYAVEESKSSENTFNKKKK
ncbi:MAG: RNA-binding protein [Paludibacteraceae bacterium]|nr:RNA-binding protein [Paludibacteraceae bacterium]